MFEKIVSALMSLFKGQLSTMDVAKQLDDNARDMGGNLDWRNSTEDLAKTLKLDGSLTSRAKLAQEFGYNGPFTGTADQNIWLHGQLMQKIAAHGFKL